MQKNGIFFESQPKFQKSVRNLLAEPYKEIQNRQKANEKQAALLKKYCITVTNNYYDLNEEERASSRSIIAIARKIIRGDTKVNKNDKDAYREYRMLLNSAYQVLLNVVCYIDTIYKRSGEIPGVHDVSHYLTRISHQYDLYTWLYCCEGLLKFEVPLDGIMYNNLQNAIGMHLAYKIAENWSFFKRECISDEEGVFSRFNTDMQDIIKKNLKSHVFLRNAVIQTRYLANVRGNVWAETDDSVISVCNQNAIKILNKKTKCEYSLNKNDDSWVTAVFVTSDKKYLIAGSTSGTIEMWDTETGFLVRSFGNGNVLNNQQDKINSIYVTKDNKQMLVGLGSNIKRWDIETGNWIHTFTVPLKRIDAICVSPDNRYIACVDTLGVITISEFATGKFIRMINNAMVSMTDICFTLDGRYLIANAYKEIKMWDMITGDVYDRTNFFAGYNRVHILPTTNGDIQCQYFENSRASGNLFYSSILTKNLIPASELHLPLKDILKKYGDNIIAHLQERMKEPATE